MNKKSLLAAVGIAILVACGTAKNSGNAKVEVLPTQGDVDRVQAKFPGYTLDELHEGKKLFETNCNLCHGLKRPASRTEDEWRKIVPRMVKKVNSKEGHSVSADGEEKILRYVITMGSVEKS